MQNCEEQLLASYVCPSTWNTLAPIGGIFVKFDIWSIFKKSLGRLRFH